MTSKMSGIGGGAGARYGRGAAQDAYHDNHYRRQAMRGDRSDNDGSTEPTHYSQMQHISY